MTLNTLYRGTTFIYPEQSCDRRTRWVQDPSKDGCLFWISFLPFNGCCRDVYRVSSRGDFSLARSLRCTRPQLSSTSLEYLSRSAHVAICLSLCLEYQQSRTVSICL